MKNQRFNFFAKLLLYSALALFLGIYIAYQLFRSNYQSVETETAYKATLSDEIETEALFVRDEQVIYNDYNNVLSYKVKDGGRVSTNGVIATIYASALDALRVETKSSLEQELANLKILQAQGNAAHLNLTSLKGQIYNDIYSLKASIDESDRNRIKDSASSLLYRMNEWQIGTSTLDLAPRISKLEAELNSSEYASINTLGNITSPKAGFFVRQVDGYEQAYDYNDVKNFTLSSWSREVTPSNVGTNAIGKICTSYDYYIITKLNSDDALKFAVGKEYEASLPYASTKKIPVKVVSINQTNKQSDAVVIFTSGYMDENIANARKEVISITTSAYEGIRISQSNIHFNTLTKTFVDEHGNEHSVTKLVKGVYVINGNAIKFVEIVPIYSTSSYVLCKTNLTRSEISELMTNRSLEIYDEVVVEGTNLYDGKIVR